MPNRLRDNDKYLLVNDQSRYQPPSTSQLVYPLLISLPIFCKFRYILYDSEICLLFAMFMVSDSFDKKSGRKCQIPQRIDFGFAIFSLSEGFDNDNFIRLNDITATLVELRGNLIQQKRGFDFAILLNRQADNHHYHTTLQNPSNLGQARY